MIQIFLLWIIVPLTRLISTYNKKTRSTRSNYFAALSLAIKNMYVRVIFLIWKRKGKFKMIQIFLLWIIVPLTRLISTCNKKTRSTRSNYFAALSLVIKNMYVRIIFLIWKRKGKENSKWFKSSYYESLFL